MIIEKIRSFHAAVKRTTSKPISYAAIGFSVVLIFAIAMAMLFAGAYLIYFAASIAFPEINEDALKRYIYLIGAAIALVVDLAFLANDFMKNNSTYGKNLKVGEFEYHPIKMKYIYADKTTRMDSDSKHILAVLFPIFSWISIEILFIYAIYNILPNFFARTEEPTRIREIRYILSTEELPKQRVHELLLEIDDFIMTSKR